MKFARRAKHKLINNEHEVKKPIQAVYICPVKTTDKLLATFEIKRKERFGNISHILQYFKGFFFEKPFKCIAAHCNKCFPRTF